MGFAAILRLDGTVERFGTCPHCGGAETQTEKHSDGYWPNTTVTPCAWCFSNTATQASLATIAPAFAEYGDSK